MKNQFIPHEDNEQALVVEFLELKGYKFSKLAQETYTKSWQVKMRNKWTGLRPGVPDMIVLIPPRLGPGVTGKVLFIEMKRTKGGTVSREQKDWIEAINRCTNVTAKVCRGYEEAKAFIEEETEKLCTTGKKIS